MHRPQVKAGVALERLKISGTRTGTQCCQWFVRGGRLQVQLVELRGDAAPIRSNRFQIERLDGHLRMRKK